MSGRPRIRLSIDRLALYGVDRIDAAAAQRALRSELESRLAGVDAGSLRPGHRGRIRADIPPVDGVAELGKGAARAIAARLSAPGRGRR